MKALLVTSQVTYVPGNYLSCFREVLSLCPQQIGGLILLRNRNPALLAKASALIVAGAPRLGFTLLCNYIGSFSDRRKKLFRKRRIPVFDLEDINAVETVELVKDLSVDLIVNMRTRSKYKKEILESAGLGCINIHHGILPRYRGTMCDLYALSEGRPAGFSIHVMTDKLDDGPILEIKKHPEEGEKNYLKYLGKSGRVEGRALADLLKRIDFLGSIPDGIPNVNSQAVYCKTPSSASQIKELRKRGVRL